VEKYSAIFEQWFDLPVDLSASRRSIQEKPLFQPALSERLL
jgi:hypothetical protein